MFMPKKQNGFLKSKKLLYLLPILLFAAVGGYFVFASQAAQRGDRVSHGFNEYWNYGDFNNYVPQPGDTLKGTIDIDINSDEENTYTTAYQAIFITAYDTKVYKPMNGNCVWRFGCTVSSVNTASIDAAVAQYYNEGLGVHKHRVAICFNIPANTTFAGTAFTYTLQRTSYVPTHTTPSDNWVTSAEGHADGSCESNPSAAGFVLDGINDACGGTLPCDDGTGPGAGPGTFTGMSGSGGNGTGGNGTGNNGQGTGPGPGSSGGGGGSSATRQGDQPNTTPTTSNQGDNKEEPKLEPSPFFDGKEFEKGSDSDTLANTVRSTSRKIANTWPIVLGVILLGGAAGYVIWRRNNQRSRRS